MSARIEPLPNSMPSRRKSVGNEPYRGLTIHEPPGWHYQSRLTWRNEFGKVFQLPNRRERRAQMHRGDRVKGCNLVQVIPLPNGKTKTIFHNAALIRKTAGRIS